MSTETKRTILRKALGDRVGSGESSASEDTVKPITSEQAVQRFGHYELVIGEDGKPVELGRGAIGVTYKAFDTGLRRPVTLKVIGKRYLGDESAQLRFLREVRAAASLRHPNVASVFDLGRTGSSYFYAMEFVEGETLENLIKRSGRLEVRLALEIATQAAAGLVAIHKQKLVHRDIKPSNIMVSVEERSTVTAKIIDLGLAKPAPDAPVEAQISTPGAFAGTPEFASPEQFAGIGVDIRSDLYSLGVTLWAMLIGQVPFRGTAAEVMYQHLHAPLPLAQLEGFPQPVVLLLEVLLEKDPGRRFQNPAELLKAIPTTQQLRADNLDTASRMPKQPSTESQRDPATEEALRRIEAARKSGARRLDLSYLKLRTLPEAIGRLSKLQELYLFGNQLNTLHEAIGRLSKLQQLNLERNQLSTLHEAIGQLSQLQKLNLFGNRLSTLPEAVGQLSKLRELYVGGNQLGTLPEAIGQLFQLQELDLTGNKLSTLPEAVQSLERLEKLYLHGNPGLGLPDEVLGPTIVEVLGPQKRSAKPPREILDYYFATRGAKGLALREVKLIVVGRGGAGKTSLIKRLKGEPFNPHEGETHGINIRELELACTDGPVQARVWDFGGQHVLHAMHEFFLTARSLYLLVLGERDDMAERDAVYWLQLIRSYAGPAPVVVALNKSGGRRREMDRRTLEDKCGPTSRGSRPSAPSWTP